MHRLRIHHTLLILILITTLINHSEQQDTSSSSPIELELDLSTPEPSSSTSSFLDRIGLSNLQQRLENALKATGQRWQELKPRLAELGNELKSLVTNRTAMIESIERFANNTGILVKIREKIKESSDG